MNTTKENSPPLNCDFLTSYVSQAAFVLGHEMAHHHLDHHAEGISLVLVGSDTKKENLTPPIPVAEPHLFQPPCMGSQSPPKVPLLPILPFSPCIISSWRHQSLRKTFVSLHCRPLSPQQDDPSAWLSGGQVPHQLSKVSLGYIAIIH